VPSAFCDITFIRKCTAWEAKNPFINMDGCYSEYWMAMNWRWASRKELGVGGAVGIPVQNWNKESNLNSVDMKP